MINLSQLVNGKLLPELEKLGIPCPAEARDVHQPATEYHEFTICTTTPGASILALAGAKRRSAVAVLTPIKPGLHLSRIKTITPARSSSLLELGVDIEEKVLQVEDPKLFETALTIITTRWRAMQRYEDIHTLSYIEIHSRTERALFSQEHINRLLFLAGHEPDMDIPFASLPYESAIVYIKQARQRMNLTMPGMKNND